MALEEGKWSASHPGRVNPGKTRYPLYRRLGEPQSWSGQVRKISPPPGFDPRTVQPVASHYTDWATRPVYRKCKYYFQNLADDFGINLWGCTLPYLWLWNMGRDSSVCITTRYGLGGPGIESRYGDEIFRTRPDRSCGPPSHLYKEYRVFPNVKAAGAWLWPPTLI